MNIPKSIKMAQVSREVDNASLLKAVAKSQSWLSLVLNGKRDIRVSTLEVLAELFEMPVSEFIRLGES